MLGSCTYGENKHTTSLFHTEYTYLLFVYTYLLFIYTYPLFVYTYLLFIHTYPLFVYTVDGVADEN